MNDLEVGIRSALLLYKRSRASAQGGFALEIQLLSNVSKLYVHYYHEQKCARKRASVSLLRKSSVMKQEILRVLEDQNRVTFDNDDVTLDDELHYVESDIHSELVFDCLCESGSFGRENFPSSSRSDFCPSGAGRHDPGQCQSGRSVLEAGPKRSSRLKQRRTIFNSLKTKKPKRTLLQKMKRFRERKSK